MSMSDWNDKAYGERMVLSTTQKYEGLKSLRVECVQSAVVAKILTATETANPQSANYDFYTYFPSGGGAGKTLGFFFRYQDLTNFYVLWMSHTNAKFILKEAGADTLADSSGTVGADNVWIHWKVYFCEIGGVVYCRLYKEVSGEWSLVYEQTLTAKFTSGGAVGVGAYGWGMVCAGGCYAYIDLFKTYYT